MKSVHFRGNESHGVILQLLITFEKYIYGHGRFT